VEHITAMLEQHSTNLGKTQSRLTFQGSTQISRTHAISIDLATEMVSHFQECPKERSWMMINRQNEKILSQVSKIEKNKDGTKGIKVVIHSQLLEWMIWMMVSMMT
jgi:hypothetical protein